MLRQHLDRLHALGLLLFNVKGDGNCFFRALSICLTGAAAKHKYYRMKVTARMKKYPDVVKGVLGLETVDEVIDRANKLAQNATWVSDKDILAICQLMNLNILEASTGFAQTFIPMTAGIKAARTIGMVLTNGNHYVPIVSKKALIIKWRF